MKKALLLCVLAVFSVLQVIAQSRHVTGKVLDESGNPVPFATIRVRGTNVGTQAAADGSFSLNVPVGKEEVEVSYVGYDVAKAAIKDGAVTVRLNKSTAALDEVVVTGYQTVKRTSLTGAIATVDAKKVQDIPVLNIGNALQGKAAGVQITAQNGAPGQNAFIRIRGVGSLAAGSDPIFVIDGVIADTRAYNALNTNDIADLTILKDASSSAIYGARGANGVIVITTKKGKGGEPVVKVNTEYGQQSRIKDNYKMMSTAQKLQYEYDLDFTNYYISNWMSENGYDPNSTDIQSVPMDKLKGEWANLEAHSTNWFDVVMQDATLLKNQISIAGADDKFNYYVSLDHSQQDGILRESSFKRTGGRLNLTYKAKKWLTLGTNTSFSSYRINALRDRYNAQNPFVAAYTTNPYEQVMDSTVDNYKGYNLTVNGFPIMEALKHNPSFNITNYGGGTYYAAVHPIRDLEVKTQIGLQYVDYQSEAYTQPGSYLDNILNGKPTGNKTDAGFQTFNYVWTNTANYRHTFNENHNVSLLVGSEFTKNHQKTYSMSQKGFASPDLTTLDNGASPQTATTSKNDWTLWGLFATGSYNYKEKYFVDGSIRRDGSSRFGSNTKYGTFYSVGLAWDVAKEEFMHNIEWVNTLKVRGSIGSSGNFNIGNYNSQSLYNFASYNGSSAAKPSQLPSPDLAWEKQTTTSLGIDFAAFDSRLTGSIDYYDQKRQNLLQLVPIPSTVGFTNILLNLGSMKNTGVELALKYQFVKSQNLDVTFGGNIAFNKNRVTKLTGKPNEEIPQPDGYTTLKVGKPYLNFYMVRSAGTDPNNGDALYYDNDGKVTNVYSSSYSQVLDGKSPNPTYSGGLNLDVRWKQFFLAASANYAGGNYIYNIIYENALADGYNVSSWMSTDAFNYWKKPGDKNVQPKPVLYNSNFYDSDRWLQKGDYIRLRDVTLSYSVPANVLARTKVIKGLSLYATGHNLATYRPHYKGDPEVGIGSTESDPTSPITGSAYINGVYSLYSYPNYKSWTVGINVTL
ncbi:hypothetical protein DCC81_04795 [Chitinophaga parva]|uniref:SusC/RagA family TonB-linked outer membrane protein n=1 Tax=Chitinophaga parva TaxID=2169414 RepID=A0A2T7BMC7_9BACT|nr:SusC/RagA family TonB-linked outer membrane protein [Chitinophaga parva]PUZ28806.1 hypothetical protein DCC81_04795 [Chitinophaga parva]